MLSHFHQPAPPYPGDATTLARDVRALLEGVQPQALRPKALIAPHAGDIYSGPIAASAYALFKPIANSIRRVIFLGPTHRVAVRGLALPGGRLLPRCWGRWR